MLCAEHFDGQPAVNAVMLYNGCFESVDCRVCTWLLCIVSAVVHVCSVVLPQHSMLLAMLPTQAGAE